MRVALYYSNKDIRLAEMPRPTLRTGEALMRVEASGICGSDVMEWYRRDKIPLVLGHEVSGVIVELGDKVKKFKVGDRVVATHHVPCHRCRYCLDGHPTVCETLRRTHFDPGGFAQWIRLPALNVELGTFRVPQNVSFEEATFVEPLGCVLRGQRLAGVKKEKTVLVIGSGSAGLLHVKFARYLKVKKIIATDIDRYRLKAARRFGATTVIHAGEDVPQRIKKVNGGRLADFVMICSGAQSALAQGLRSVERGGSVLLFTAAQKDTCLPVATNEIFWRNETTLLSSYAASPQDLKEALKLIAERTIVVKDMITHRLKLDDIQRGFQLVVCPKRSIKVIINPHS